jgi:hypothetical protein
VTRAVAALPERERHPWAWRLLSDLVHNTRGAVDELLADAGAAVRELVLARSAPAVAVTARLPEQALDLLGGYLEFLGGGGRARAYFRAAPQRDVEPVLSRVTVDGRRPESADDVRRVVAHLRTAARLRRVDALCPEVGLPRPRTEAELVAMAEDLAAVAAAAGAIAALRHDVLFLADGSPVEVPDVDAALRVAAAVLAAGERAAVRGVGRQLDRMADELARSVPAAATAPEHARAVAALRAHDAAAYAAAVDGFAAARREVRDETRRRELLDRLAGAAPRLAEAWADGTATGPAAPGFAAFVPADQLLAALPPPDSADVVVVHRAAGLGLDRLLLAAVAPRMVAAGAVPDGRPAVATDLLGVLRKAAAPVVGGPAADRVPRARAGD